MTDSGEVAREDFDSAELQLAELLDRYVESLQSGQETVRLELLKKHPQLAELAVCLESLESLVLRPPGAGEPQAADVHSDDTLITSGTGEIVVPASSGSGMAPPAEFGKYELLEELGRGGMGVVYKARQKDLDRLVALKMILSSQLASAEDVRRFYEEAKTAGGLRHPHIVGIHEVGQIRGQHYFAMDYVEGQSLAEILGDGPIDPETSVECLAALSRAAHYLHQHDIVHRDLKPANVLIDDSGEPFLTDFGLAKVFNTDSGHTRTGSILGTASYMPPEQAAGKTTEITPKSDVYSLGAILYEMLTGRPPFKESNPLDTLVQVLEGEPTLPSRVNRQVPRELELICLRCLEKNPADRYATAEKLAEDLERFLKSEPVEARPSGVFHRMRRWGRREPALAAHLAGVFAAAAIVQIKYSINGTELGYHLQVMSVLAGWAAASLVFQRMLNRERLEDITRFAWAAADVVFLTSVLAIADPPRGPLLIGYPLLVAASGMFFRVRLVVFMTAVALVSFGVLMTVTGDEELPVHYPIIYAAALGVLGFVVAHQVYRVRVLSRYYESRRP